MTEWPHCAAAEKREQRQRAGRKGWISGSESERDKGGPASALRPEHREAVEESHMLDYIPNLHTQHYAHLYSSHAERKKRGDLS